MLSEGTEAAVCESPFKLSDRSFRHLTPAGIQRGSLFTISPSRWQLRRSSLSVDNRSGGPEC
jgi:hypothetical protein